MALYLQRKQLRRIVRRLYEATHDGWVIGHYHDVYRNRDYPELRIAHAGFEVTIRYVTEDGLQHYVYVQSRTGDQLTDHGRYWILGPFMWEARLWNRYMRLGERMEEVPSGI